jgi:hypothetical protein
VIEKNAEEGETAEEIKSEIALHGRRVTRDGHQLNPWRNLPLVLQDQEDSDPALQHRLACRESQIT